MGDQRYSVCYQNGNNSKCQRCKTYMDAGDLCIGVATSSYGIVGTPFWRHLTCTELILAQKIFDVCEGEEMEGVLVGWDTINEEDRKLVRENLIGMLHGPLPNRSPLWKIWF